MVAIERVLTGRGNTEGFQFLRGVPPDPERFAVQAGVWQLSATDQALLHPSIKDKFLVTELPTALKPMFDALDTFVREEKKIGYREAITSAKTMGDAVSVLKTYDIPQKLVTEGQRILEIPIPEAAKPTLHAVFERYVDLDLKSQFEFDMREVTTVKDAMVVLGANDVPQHIAKEFGLESLKFGETVGRKVRPVAWAIPLVLTACLGVPQVGSSQPPDQWGAFFNANPEAFVMNMANWGAIIGGVLGALAAGRPAVDQVFGHEHKPIHTAIFQVVLQTILEAFENYFKAGAAASGLVVFAGDVPVANMKTLGTVMSVGLVVQTISEFITEPLMRAMQATAPPEGHGGHGGDAHGGHH